MPENNWKNSLEAMMSTCPEKDLHSIYLDGELPEEFLKEYENHVAGCEKCKAELEKLRKVSVPF